MERELAVKIYGNEGLAGRVALFNQKATTHKTAQKANPFSASWTKGSSQPSSSAATPGRPARHEDGYGTPVPGSKTDYRGKRAGELVSNEIKLLCDMIWEFGERQPDDTALISFGELFEIYVRISNKLVGTLLRARKHGLLSFKGEMLFQRRDDDVIIALLLPIQEIRKQTCASARVDVSKPAPDQQGGQPNPNEETCGGSDV